MKVGWHVVVVVVVVAAVIMLTRTVDGRRVDIGGKDGWTQGFNYTLWASNQTFYVDDWLLFRFDKYAYDVLEVNQTSYENCNADHFIHNITRGSGRDWFQVKETKPYYFICSKGYCYGGMKLAINVTKPPTPAPPPQTNSASTLFGPVGKIVISPVSILAILILAFAIKV